MNTYIDIGGSETLSLKGALLVYEGRDKGFITWHEAKQLESGGAPCLGEAQELTTEFVHRLAHGLGSRTTTELLPHNVLARTAEMVVWWTARSVRRMFFRTGSEAPKALSGRRFPQPALVWKVVGRDLYLRALTDNRRPNAETPLMVAPYWNVDGEAGSVCQGTMRSPEEFGSAAIPIWEKSFFQSEFTHQTGIRRLTSHPGGYFGLWRQAAGGRRRFPDGCLVPSKQSLRDFIMQEQ